MNTDKLTTWLGFAQAGVIGVIDYMHTSQPDGSINWQDPMFYVGATVAFLVAIKAYYTNKP